MAIAEGEPTARPTRALDDEQLSVRWPGVWTGFLIGMGILSILTALGMAVGVSAANTNVALWWGAISFMIAMFLGGAISARWVTGTLTGVLQGALVWVLAVASVFLLGGFGISLGAHGLFAAMNSPAMNAAMQQMAANANQAMSQVGTTGTNAVQSAAPAAWVTFVVLALTAIAAIIGGLAGQQREARSLA
jgi:hypothetical protein